MVLLLLLSGKGSPSWIGVFVVAVLGRVWSGVRIDGTSSRLSVRPKANDVFHRRFVTSVVMSTNVVLSYKTHSNAAIAIPIRVSVTKSG